MRKYEFRIGDTVREITVDKRPVIGKVIGCGSSAEHDFYRIASKGEIYSARDDEIELLRRAPNKYEKMGLVDRFTLDWYGPDKHPAAGEECMIAWTGFDGKWRELIAFWRGTEWEIPGDGSEKTVHMDLDMIDAWAPWEWPDTARSEAGEEGGDHDESADPDDR